MGRPSQCAHVPQRDATQPFHGILPSWRAFLERVSYWHLELAKWWRRQRRQCCGVHAFSRQFQWLLKAACRGRTSFARSTNATAIDSTDTTYRSSSIEDKLRNRLRFSSWMERRLVKTIKTVRVRVATVFVLTVNNEQCCTSHRHG